MYIVTFNHGYTSRSIEVQVTPAPIQIKSIDPPAGSRFASVTVRGTGFGKEQPFDVREGLFLHNKRALIDAWSDTEIKARVPDAKSGKFVVKRNRIILLDERLLPLFQELNRKAGQIEQLRNRGKQLRTWNRQPPNLPYDRSQADLKAMYQSLAKGLGEQERKLSDLVKQREDLQRELDKAVSDKIARKPAGPTERARLQAQVLSLEAQIALTQQRQIDRDKKLTDITKAVPSLAPRSVPVMPVAGDGAPYRMMHYLVRTNAPK